MDNNLEEAFVQNGYMKVPSNMPQLTVFYGKTLSLIYGVLVFDYSSSMELTKEKYEHIKTQVYQLFIRSGVKSVHLFSLLVTKEIDAAEKLNYHDTASWIVDVEEKRILACEHQSEDFYGLKEIIKQYLSGDIKTSSQSVRSDYSQDQEVEKSWWDKKSPAEKRRLKKRYRKSSILARNYAPVNTAIVIINIIIFILLEIGGSTENVQYMLDKGAMLYLNVLNGKEYYRLFTCMFMHFGFEHLIGNMVVLFFLGDNVERALGKVKYLITYLLSGLCGSLASMYFAYFLGEMVVSAGASGAVFGIVGALLYIVLKNKGRLEEMTTFKVLLFIGYTLYVGFTSVGIDNAAHLGGLISGYLIAFILYRKDSKHKM